MITAVWGENKTGKTSHALTYPEEIWHADFDVGLHRAIHRFKDKKITSNKYFTPSIRRGIALSGVKELWYKFEDDYLAALESKSVQTVIIDPANQLWQLCRFAYLQEKQENQKTGDKPRENLTQIEYGEPNARMRRIIQEPRKYDKHLVMTHYATPEYGNRLNPQTGAPESYQTGRMQIDAFKETEGLVDLVLYTYTKKVKVGEIEKLLPFGEIMLSGLGLELVGQTMIEPSYEQIINLQSMLRGE